MIHDNSIHSLAISNDNSLLASGSSTGNVKIWKIKTGKCLRKIKRAHKTSITSLKFTSDGLRILSSSKKIRLYGLQSGNKLK